MATQKPPQTANILITPPPPKRERESAWRLEIGEREREKSKNVFIFIGFAGLFVVCLCRCVCVCVFELWVIELFSMFTPSCTQTQKHTHTLVVNTPTMAWRRDLCAAFSEFRAPSPHLPPPTSQRPNPNVCLGTLKSHFFIDFSCPCPYNHCWLKGSCQPKKKKKGRACGV